ncbi:MAG: phytanoyl-CoA dioxygenase family protein [Phycisphaeraceae bacterium]|nr:phytanoyl-CoA dioxygenase family protein [Phycisphaeraceae bacterium]
MKTAPTITDDQVQKFHDDGFVKIEQMLDGDEARRWREPALAASKRLTGDGGGRSVFQQTVNVWRKDAEMKKLTLDPRIAAAVTRLAGRPMRLWHDHILIKAPGKSTPTEFHQDRPYWPFQGDPLTMSCWLALGDVSPEAGCMSFIPGSHRYTDLPSQNLSDPESLMSLCPELRWEPRVTHPLRSGDCTFHNGLCAHTAGPNTTDEPRIGHVVLFVEADTRYSGKNHVVTDPLDLEPGQTLPDDICPLAADLIDRD